MRTVILTLISFSLFGCGYSTGISPIDDITNPRKACVKDYVIDNHSSQTLAIDASMISSTDDEDCNNYEADDKPTLSPGQSTHVRLELKCRYCGPRTSANITHQQPVHATTRLDLVSTDNAAALLPGLQFQIFNRDTGQHETIAMIAAPAQSGKAFWPSSSGAPNPNVAWVLGTVLFISMPTDLTGGPDSFEAGFPANLMLLGFPSRLENGYQKVAVSLVTDELLSAPDAGNRTHVICDDSGCVSDKF